MLTIAVSYAWPGDFPLPLAVPRSIRVRLALPPFILYAGRPLKRPSLMAYGPWSAFQPLRTNILEPMSKGRAHFSNRADARRRRAGDGDGGSSWRQQMSPRHWPSGEVREGADRVGFEVVTLDGRRGPLASSKISRHNVTYLCDCSTESFRWPTVGKYKVDVASFESLALPQLQVS
ncbi:hypothetical protein GW17_00016782 [Ensete ventricosum]|uniref:Uncharacterized protein n=1 Tax=Ensete ventricosum TaxID=4639 RepID=A0A444F9B9_ENSVE|nr:hypothetical protein GW17_00016782 [Ensete ventricosum]RZR71370.1 hypothetical protein BHM03_00004863 [Ensete ventricosum]